MTRQKKNLKTVSVHYKNTDLILNMISCCRTAVGVGQRALSLSAHTVGGPPPPPGPGEGGVTILGV